MTGFPLAYLNDDSERIRLKIVDEMLWVLPPNVVSHSINRANLVRDSEGFICTGDRVEISDGRVMFRGREGAAVNVGGTKIEIEDVERIVNQHPDVAECLIEPRRSAIVGTVLALKVVPKDAARNAADLRREIKTWCISRLPREALPASIAVVDNLPVTPAGKLSRIP